MSGCVWIDNRQRNSFTLLQLQNPKTDCKMWKSCRGLQGFSWNGSNNFHAWNFPSRTCALRWMTCSSNKLDSLCLLNIFVWPNEFPLIIVKLPIFYKFRLRWHKCSLQRYFIQKISFCFKMIQVSNQFLYQANMLSNTKRLLLLMTQQEKLSEKARKRFNLISQTFVLF